MARTTRRLGTIEVSPIGMGCMGFSHGYGEVPPEDYAVDAIRAAHDAGCTLFDTAETYGTEQFWPGHNEQLVGKAVEPFRDEVVLATKLHIATEEWEAAGRDVGSVVRRHLEASLGRLRTDHVELYYLHRFNEDIGMVPVARAMGRLVDEGLIRGWGVSQVGPELLREAHETCPVSAVQSLYNMLERDAEAEVIPYCLAHGIGFVPFSPIASGFLSGKVTAQTTFGTDDVRKYVPQLSQANIAANQPVLDLLARYAREKGATSAQVSLAWMLHKYPNVVPIPGSKNKGRILENLGAWDVELTDEEFDGLERALDALPVHGHRGIEESQQRSFGDNWARRG